LSFPHKIPDILFTAVCITLFLTFIARPLAVFAVLAPFKGKTNQIAFVSAAGLRGAASIVFAIMVVAESELLRNDLFHIVFVVALLSVAFQGTILPYLAKKWDMIDKFADVRKTFNDYQQESAISLNTINVTETHPWNGTYLKEISLNNKALILQITRGEDKVVPRGDTQLLAGDSVLIGTSVEQAQSDIRLCETFIDDTHEWKDKRISSLNCPDNFLIALIKRDGVSFVPNGKTVLKLGDTVVFYAS
jgi:cell volume regulation protein A